MRALLLAATFCLITVPAFAVDPWAGTPVETAQVNDVTGGATVVAEDARSGFGNPFANASNSALDGMDDDAATLNTIAPAAGETTDADADAAAAVEPAAGTEPVIEDNSGEPVEIAPEDKGTDIVGP